ncbi:hypothetical protein M3_0045 [Lysinibacillus phage vB_LfM_LysYB1]|nr:hypothetical protein M3_0045 [Lysinibacillus phage vB_LfM_LysYB1]WAB25212.1 hypothetical protein M5_0034 [Lysinibacillus phage vB_LfM_LysYB2]
MSENTMNNEMKFTDENVKLIAVIGDQVKSRTQSIKTAIIEKNGEKAISVQKWWRKSSEEPWMEGKGFHFNPEDTEILMGDLSKALSDLKQLNG